MAKKYISPEMLNDWIQKYESGVPARHIAKTCDFSQQTICARLKDAGVNVSASRSLSAIRKGVPSKQKGCKRTPETCSRMSAARKGIPGKKGYRFTDDQRENMRAARLRYMESSPEKFRQDIAAANKAVPRLSEHERSKRNKARSLMKSMVRRILTMSGVRKDRKSEEILGYSKQQLIGHIESQFHTGMSWDKRESFHIDHRVPVAWFLKNGIYDPKVICALSNLQPLYPDDNRRKGDRFDHKSNRHMAHSTADSF